MNVNEKSTGTRGVNARDRFWRVWFAPLAAVGALAALVTGAFRARPAATLAPPPAPAPPPTPGVPRALRMAPVQAVPAPPLARHYGRTGAIGGTRSADGFSRRLSGVAVGAGDHAYVLGDEQIRVFDPLLRRVRAWRAPENASSLGVGPDGRVYVGSPGRVEIFDADGKSVGGFAAGDPGKPADVTGIKVFGTDVLVADANARVIRRYGIDGALRSVIGRQEKSAGFMLPNRILDLAVDARGVVYATDPGRHKVTAWALDGSPIAKFGKFGMTAPEDFVGCCNPVNIAVTPDGKVVTGEKMVARVKVFEPDGTLLAVIGPEHFDPSCVQIHLAVDSNGRILAADPVRREVTVFSMNAPSGPGARQ
jgi:hypothetical protein